MMDLPTNTTDRLLAVADIIELNPDVYRQGQWWSRVADGDDEFNPDPGTVVGLGPVCGTVACIAGWGVALSTEIPAHFLRCEGDWDNAGAYALGLDYELAEYLFECCVDTALGGNAEVADVLRRLAKLPLGERTIGRAREVLTDAQYDALFVEDEDQEDDDDDDA